MRVATVKRRVREVAAVLADSHDDEVAHGKADDLHQDVLRAIATGTNKDDPAALAAAALTTEDLDFARWCG